LQLFCDSAGNYLAGAWIIQACGTSPDLLAADLARRLPPPGGEAPDRPPFTAETKKVIEPTARKARQLGHDRTGTGHLPSSPRAADRLDDKASGFGLGADDYLTKPFELRE
jgi:hypothetical protein